MILSPLQMQELFINQANIYDLRKKRSWQVPEVKTVAYGSETIRYRGPKTWDLLPSEIKNAQTIVELKKTLKLEATRMYMQTASQLYLSLWICVNISDRFLLIYELPFYWVYTLRGFFCGRCF